jgi:hypothetical protein
MLDKAFLETADYRTLIETSDRVLVVGRRGTGKSALTQALRRYWGAERFPVVSLAPEEHEVIGTRPLVQLFGEKFNRVRAGTRLLWRYALMMETVRALASRPGFGRSPAFGVLRPHLERWNSRGASILGRFRHLAGETVDVQSSPEERIGNLPIVLDLTSVENALADASTYTDTQVFFLIDRLDEGYEPDNTGVGLVDGIVQAAIDLKTRIQHVRPVILLRDNIFRSVQALDPDYSRAIEGHVLRLHWDETSLLSFAAARLNIAFEMNEEVSVRAWNACTLPDLRGKDGFLKCLRLTLYRPRDVLALLNDAFYLAQREGRTEVGLAHVEATARHISQNRLDDLTKEYSAILPSLSRYISLFRDSNPERGVGDISESICRLFASGADDTLIQQDFFILEDANVVIRALYSIGFLAVRDQSSGRFVFCHDGRAPDREFTVGDSVLVHPCYWMALNCSKGELGAEAAEEIYDEYDIEVSSETPDLRRRKITGLMAQLEAIPEGDDGDEDFEAWCHKAIRICFAKGLRNVELKPNKLARQRRDVVATNLGKGDVWERIRDDYGTRQVTFEIKNYKGVTAADYQQIQSYLQGEYGRLAFVVTRDETVDLYAHRDVEWVRDIYMQHQVLIVKLTGFYLRRLLHKLTNPTRHDDVNDAVHKLLDTYTRLYLAGQVMTAANQTQRVSRKKMRKLAAQARQVDREG